MYRLIECLTQEHDPTLVAVAALVCVVGSGLSAHLSVRLKTASSRRKPVQIFLSALISGATVWSTHFIAMMAYDPGLEHGYEPIMTGVSLAIAIFGMALANVLLAYGKGRSRDVQAGALFGLTVAIMHYVGMAAYLFPGEIVLQPIWVAASLLLGVGFGSAAYHRIFRPMTRWCWTGGALFMILAICATHFTGMSGIEVQLSPLIEVPTRVFSDSTLGFLITGVTGIILLVGFASVSNDTNLEREANDQIRMASLRDPLTGLPNRIGLSKKMDQLSVRLANDQTAKVAVVTIDLNRFKEVNDLHGHASGDAVLKTVAERMTAVLEKNEFLFRTGGDEFVVLKYSFHRTEQIVAFGERIKAAIVKPISFGDISILVGAAIGGASTINDGRSIEDLLHKSDMAMYRAKADPEHTVCLYNAKMDQESREKLQFVQDLRSACPNGEFELHYQLQNDVNSLQPIGFEALLRWKHPVRGNVSPDEFIPVAEESGLILSIGLWVLRTACHEAAKWDSEYSIAVNVAPQQLVQHSFLENVSDILMESRLPPERLELEITEASIIDDQAHVLKIMHRLKAMGIRIAMDDFGTGYSSLATLQAFPFDKIKIDRSFVQDVHCNEQRAAIVQSTLLLGAALNIPVLAEGVELEEELEFLRSEKCTSVQGFYFGKPMDVEGVRKILKNKLPKAG